MIISGIALPRKAEHGPGRHLLYKDWKAQASHTVALRGGSSEVWTARAGIAKHRSSMISSFGVVLGLDSISNTLRFTERSSLECADMLCQCLHVTGSLSLALECRGTDTHSQRCEKFLDRSGWDRIGKDSTAHQRMGKHQHPHSGKFSDGTGSLCKRKEGPGSVRMGQHKHSAMRRSFKGWSGLHRQGGASTYTPQCGEDFKDSLATQGHAPKWSGGHRSASTHVFGRAAL